PTPRTRARLTRHAAAPRPRRSCRAPPLVGRVLRLAFATPQHTAKAAYQANERAAVRARITFRCAFLAAARAAHHAVVFLGRRRWGCIGHDTECKWRLAVVKTRGTGSASRTYPAPPATRGSVAIT